ncbi:unknown [Clostridium sp. CAG:568]|nr:unknown [Clostridium sp. CAG:568]
MKRYYMKSLLFGFVVPFFAILSLFGVGYSTWYFVNDVTKDNITISTDITGVADFGKIVINYDKNSVEDISSPSLNSKIIVESDRIHLINPFYVHYLLPKGALISSAGNVLKFNLQLTVDSGYAAASQMSVKNVMNVSYLPYSHDNSSDRNLINVGEKDVDVTTPADNTRRTVIYNGIQWRQDIELVNSKDSTKDLYNQFTVSDEGRVEEDDQYKVVSPSDSTLREADKEAAKDTFVFCSDNLSFNFPKDFKITDNSDEVDVKKNVYLYKDVAQIFSNANISFTFSVSL